VHLVCVSFELFSLLKLKLSSNFLLSYVWRREVLFCHEVLNVLPSGEDLTLVWVG
jgi:hypothetical protein